MLKLHYAIDNSILETCTGLLRSTLHFIENIVHYVRKIYIRTPFDLKCKLKFVPAGAENECLSLEYNLYLLYM